MLDQEKGSLVLTAVNDVAQDTAPLYDATLSLVTITETPQREHAPFSVEFNTSKLTKAFAENNESVLKISIPLQITSRRSNPGETLVTAPELRTTSPKGRGSESAMIVSSASGQRIQMRSVIYARSESIPNLRKGRYTMASMVVEPGCLFTIGEAKSTHRSQFLVYRLDSIAPWPADHAMRETWENCGDRLCIGNASLAAVYELDTLRGSSKYIAPEFEHSYRRKSAHDVIKRVVGYTNDILRDRRTPCYREYFSTTLPSNERYQFFGESEDSLETVAVTPDEFIAKVWEKVSEFRKDLRAEDLEGSYSHHLLPCGIHYKYDMDRNEIQVLFNLPKIGVVQTITTNLTCLPDNWMDESVLRLGRRTFEQIAAFLQGRPDASYAQKMFTAI